MSLLLTKITKNLETDAIIKTDTYEYANSNWEDQLTRLSNQKITYDEIGNPLSIASFIILGTLYMGYFAIKWAIAVIGAPMTGGSSLLVAGATP